MTIKNSFLAILAGAAALGIAPDPVVSAPEWMGEHYTITDGPLAGKKWSIERTPEFEEIGEVMRVDSPYTEVWWRKSAQIGATTFATGIIGALIDTAPNTMAMVLPTADDVKQFNAETFQEVIESCEPLRRKIKSQKSRSIEGSTTTLKKFPGGWLRFLGAHSSKQLRRRTIKYIYADEVDDYPLDLEGQGDPMKMLDARQIAFHQTGDFKKFCTSTPTVEGISRVDHGFTEGDQRYRYVPCPHCGHFHKFDFWKLKYDGAWPHNAHYFCGECGGQIDFSHQKWMRAKENGAHWKAENPKGKYPSFHLDAMYSGFTTWDHMVKAYLDAKDDPTKLKTFYNLWLGMSFKVQGEAPDAEKLFNRRSDYQAGLVPPGGLFLTMGVDVQQNRLELEVVAWGVGQTSYSIERGVLEGDTMQDDVWAALAEVLASEWTDWQGNRRRIEMACIDAGYRTQRVYRFCRGRHNAIPIKGVGSHLAPAIGTPTKQDCTPKGAKKRQSVMLWPVGTWQLKADLYGFLNMEGPTESGGYPPGWCFFPRGDMYDMSFFQQLTAEQLMDVQKRGYIDKVWVKNPKFRNEALDCRVYATAAAHKLGMGQWGPDAWQKWVELRSGPPTSGQLDMLAGLSAVVAKPRPVADNTRIGEGRQVQEGRQVH